MLWDGFCLSSKYFQFAWLHMFPCLGWTFRTKSSVQLRKTKQNQTSNSSSSLLVFIFFKMRSYFNNPKLGSHHCCSTQERYKNKLYSCYTYTQINLDSANGQHLPLRPDKKPCLSQRGEESHRVMEGSSVAILHTTWLSSQCVVESVVLVVHDGH